MLKILKKILQGIATAPCLDAALNILVKRLRKQITADAVSIYLIDPAHAEYVLVAADGLNKYATFNVRVGLECGLIGLIGRREEPIHVENAQQHPDFYHNPLIGEETFSAFLGVPIIQHRKLYGVIVIQQQDPHYFEEADEALLITLAAQLGSTIAAADDSNELFDLIQPKFYGKYKAEPKTMLTGLGCVPGIGIGIAVAVYPPADIDAVPRLYIENISHEIEALFAALHIVKADIQRLSKYIKSKIPEEEHALFEVYIRILERDNLGTEVSALIKEEHLSAQTALAAVIKQHISQFESLENDYLSERASDFRDLGCRVLAELQRSQKNQINYPKRTILIGDEITASILAEIPHGQLNGIVSAKGSYNSHVAIIARALGIPTVMGVRGIKIEDFNARKIIVDGSLGHVYLSPDRNLLADFEKLALEEQELNQSLLCLRDKPAETLDNHRILLQVNTGLALDTSLSMRVGADGVGLYRSEVPFISRDRFPSEEEQYIIYRQILKAFAPHDVTMRTLDVGGDKILSYFPVKEENPYLGWRGIRVTLDHPEIFLIQIRAMIRASQGLNNLKIMLPMVTILSEVTEASLLIDQAYNELAAEDKSIIKPKLGVMIEVPAAAYLAKELAKKVDFLSVGSNDLTQYLLAVDRNNARVANLYDSFHPALLFTLIKIVEGGHAAGVSVSICGEMAGSPLAAMLLLAMGFDALSMNPVSLPRIKWVIRNITLADARKILSETLEMQHPQEIRLHLQHALEVEGLGGLIRAGQ